MGAFCVRTWLCAIYVNMEMGFVFVWKNVAAMISLLPLGMILECSMGLYRKNRFGMCARGVDVHAKQIHVHYVIIRILFAVAYVCY